MKLICITLLFGFLNTPTVAQIIHSTISGGPWHEPGTWTNGIVPTETNSSHIYIDGPVFIDASPYADLSPLIIDQLEITTGALTTETASALIVNGTTTVSAGGTFSANGAVKFARDISVSGTMISNNNVEFSGTLSITGAGTKTFHDVMISGTMTPNAVYTVTGNITVTETGKLLPGANTTILQGTERSLRNFGPARIGFNNLTVMEGSSFLTHAEFETYGTLQISGTLTIESGFHAFGDVNVAVDTGIAIVNNKSFTIDKTLTVSSGATFTAGDGVDAWLNGNISSSGDLTLPSKIYLSSNTTLTGGGAKLFGDVLVTGIFKPNATMTISGNLLLSGSGALIEGTSTTTFAGTQSTFSNSGTGVAAFHNVLVAEGASLTNYANMLVNGTFRSTGSYNAKADLSVHGTCTISRGGNFSTLGASKISINGNLAISGTFAANCPVNFNGATKISGAGSKMFSDINITGSLSASTGVIAVSGNIVNDGTFLHNNGTIVFVGNNLKTISSRLPDPNPMNFCNLTITGGTAPVDVQCEMDIGIHGTLNLNTVTSAATIDVDGAGNNKIFTLASTGDDPATDGSIGILSADATIEGPITVQRFMSGEGRIYRYITSPVQGPNASVADWQRAFPVTGNFADPSDPGKICFKTIQARAASLFYYSEADKTYIGFPENGLAKDNFLKVGCGYAAFVRNCIDSTLLQTSGVLTEGVNRGNVLLPVTHTVPVLTYNNLVGNPYPSAIDWDQVRLTNVSPTIAVRDNGAGVFRYYTQGGAGAADIPNGIIAQGQAFWVRTTAINPSLAIAENAKATGAGGIFFRTSQPSLLRISISNQQQVLDRAYLLINPLSTREDIPDEYDAPKMNNRRDDPLEELPDLYTAPCESYPPLAVNAIPSAPSGISVSLIARDIAPGKYYFDFSRTGEFSGMAITLVDAFAASNIPLSTGPVAFVITDDALSRAPGRFHLIFGLPRVVTAVPADQPMSAYPNPTTGRFTVTTANNGGDIKIMDSDGKIYEPLSMQRNDVHAIMLDLTDFADGVYFILFPEEERKRVARIIKRSD